MTFEPVLPGPILAVVAVALIVARLVTLRPVLAATGPARRTAALRWTGLTLAVLLVLAALARPGTGTAAPADAAGGPNVFLVADVSADTAVPDVAGRPRIDAIREDLAELIARHPQARFALISFASRPSLDWPLSADAWSLEPVVAALRPDAAAGNVAAAANPLRYQLIQADQRYPRAANLVYYLGSGGGADAPPGRFDLGTVTVDGGAVLAYGELDGAATDRLRAVADQLGVPYAARAADRPLETVVPAAPGDDADPVSPRTEWYWLLSLIVAALVLVEIYLTVRELRRDRAARRTVAS